MKMKTICNEGTEPTQAKRGLEWGTPAFVEGLEWASSAFFEELDGASPSFVRDNETGHTRVGMGASTLLMWRTLQALLRLIRLR
jgi:hypothetical protein